MWKKSFFNFKRIEEISLKNTVERKNAFSKIISPHWEIIITYVIALTLDDLDTCFI